MIPEGFVSIFPAQSWLCLHWGSYLSLSSETRKKIWPKSWKTSDIGILEFSWKQASTIDVELFWRFQLLQALSPDTVPLITKRETVLDLSLVAMNHVQFVWIRMWEGLLVHLSHFFSAFYHWAINKHIVKERCKIVLKIFTTSSINVYETFFLQ